MNGCFSLFDFSYLKPFKIIYLRQYSKYWLRFEILLGIVRVISLLLSLVLLLMLGRIAVLRTQMRPIVTDRVARSVGLSVCLSACLSVCRCATVVSPAETAEPIEILFGLRTRVGPSRNHVLEGGQDLLGGVHTVATW